VVVIAGSRGSGTATFDHRFIKGNFGEVHSGGPSALHRGPLPFEVILPTRDRTTRQIIAKWRWDSSSGRKWFHWMVPIV
jgi:hypothetical protein